jgi:hypothetical protein
MRPRKALLLALAALGAGCAHVSDVRENDPGFTAEALKSGGLVVMGVVQVNEIPQVRPPLIAALEKVLTATRKDIPLVPATKAAAALDDSTARFLLLSFQMQGAPDPAWLNQAADRLAALGRYGVLARVESDKLRYAGRDAPPNDPGLQSPSGRIRVTGRDVRVLVQIYELKTRAKVFDAKYIGVAETAEPDTIPPALGRPNAGTGQAQPIEQEFPRPPPLASALEPAFLEFARSLPGGPPQH